MVAAPCIGGTGAHKAVLKFRRDDEALDLDGGEPHRRHGDGESAVAQRRGRAIAEDSCAKSLAGELREDRGIERDFGGDGFGGLVGECEVEAVAAAGDEGVDFHGAALDQAARQPEHGVIAVEEFSRAVAVKFALQVGVALDEVCGEIDLAARTCKGVGDEEIDEDAHVRPDVVVVK